MRTATRRVLLNTASSDTNTLHLTATTTGAAETVTINRITPAAGKSLTITWGDGNSTVVAAGDIAAKSNVYAAAGTYNITVSAASNIVQLDIHNAKLSGFHSSELAASILTDFWCYSIGNAAANVVNSADMASWTPATWNLSTMPAGTYAIDSADMALWTPTAWYLNTMPAGTYAIDSADMALWTPTTWWLTNMPAGTYAIDSADMASWTPTTWYLNTMPAGTYAIDSADMASWTPATWNLSTMPAGTYAIDSADMALWTPTTWYLNTMPAGTYAIDSADMASWTPTTWCLNTMPAGTYAIDSADMALWTPTTWWLTNMPAGTYAIDSADMASWTPTTWWLTSITGGGVGWTLTAANFAGWVKTTNFQIQGNALTQDQVDAVLYGLYQATLSRTVTAGTINIGGTNSAPSGVYQACVACPVGAATPGKEIAHELLNDGCNAIAAGETWSTVTITV